MKLDLAVHKKIYIMIFHPDKVIDKATFEDPHQYAEDMVHVLVNGIQVLENGDHTAGESYTRPGYSLSAKGK